MHERKVEMAKRVGAFVGLPGGYGTFEEVSTELLLGLSFVRNVLEGLTLLFTVNGSRHLDADRDSLKTYVFFHLFIYAG